MEYGPLGVEHLTNKRVSLDTLLDFVSDLHMKSNRQVLYVVLSLEDFRVVNYQAAQYITLRGDKNGVPRLRQLYGMYISVDVRLPKGDVLLLYED